MEKATTPIFDIIEIKQLREGFVPPEKSTEHSAAYDLFVPEDTRLKAGRQIIPLGFAMAMPDQKKANIQPRSGYEAGGLKVYIDNEKEARIDADVLLGLIDSDYRGEVGAILKVKDPLVSIGKLYLKKGQAIAQMTFDDVPLTRLQMAIELPDSGRGTKGFGEANNEGVRQ